MKKSIKIMLLSSSSLGLAGCQTTTDTEILPVILPVIISAPEAALQMFSDDVGDLGEALRDGEELTARSVSVVGQNRNYSTDVTSLASGTTVAVRRSANGELEFTLNGVVRKFTANDKYVSDDGNVYGYTVNDDENEVYYYLFSNNGDLDEIQTPGNGWSNIFVLGSNKINATNADNEVRAFAAIGTETRDSALAGLATATYSGRGRLEAFPATGFENFETSRTKISTDMTMTADFGAGKISGTLDNVSIERFGGQEEQTAGSITMNSTPFIQNGYKGTLSTDAAWREGFPDLVDGTYSGAFYGPAAEEVGGVLSATGTNEDGAFNAYGYFIGDQDD